MGGVGEMAVKWGDPMKKTISILSAYDLRPGCTLFCFVFCLFSQFVHLSVCLKNQGIEGGRERICVIDYSTR